MAKEKGIYEKYGIEVNIINGGYNKDVTTFLKEGKADFGIMFLSEAIIKRAKNTELVNIGQIFQSSEIMFVARKNTGIDSVKDFTDKKIAVWRTIFTELTIGFLNKSNIKAEVFQTNEGVNLFLKNAVEICAIMHYNEYDNLINYGINPDELSVFYFRDYGMDFPEDGIYCLEKTYNEDPELCKNFAKASIEGWTYALSHTEETLSVVKKYQKTENVSTSKTHSKWMLERMGEIIQPTDKNVKNGELLESDYNSTVDFLINSKVIAKKIDYNVFFRGAK